MELLFGYTKKYIEFPFPLDIAERMSPGYSSIKGINWRMEWRY